MGGQIIINITYMEYLIFSKNTISKPVILENNPKVPFYTKLYQAIQNYNQEIPFHVELYQSITQLLLPFQTQLYLNITKKNTKLYQKICQIYHVIPMKIDLPEGLVAFSVRPNEQNPTNNCSNEMMSSPPTLIT